MSFSLTFPFVFVCRARVGNENGEGFIYNSSFFSFLIIISILGGKSRQAGRHTYIYTYMQMRIES